MPRAKMAATLSIEDDIRLGSWRLAIAGEARPGARHEARRLALRFQGRAMHLC